MPVRLLHAAPPRTYTLPPLHLPHFCPCVDLRLGRFKFAFWFCHFAVALNTFYFNFLPQSGGSSRGSYSSSRGSSGSNKRQIYATLTAKSFQNAFGCATTRQQRSQRRCRCQCRRPSGRVTTPTLHEKEHFLPAEYEQKFLAQFPALQEKSRVKRKGEK